LRTLPWTSLRTLPWISAHFTLDRCALHLGHCPGCIPFIGSSLAVWSWAFVHGLPCL
jgi:hypothetical protein